MKSAERTSNIGGPGALGGSRQPKTRGDHSQAVGKLTPSKQFRLSPFLIT